ncbi:flagellar biosynthesis protein FlhF [Desulfuromonas versatilis]|uniref:Flagellar biosynthesis protein FlhF n=1 Tax=Desulfuromonas versatilis TaxID=2802975 RepID=A0ABM8HUL6_9BACT|nr:flagellar biosynthesis protein FlhF [Desulfuromonas versatilis]BCR06617.1 flagellar biosynthesis protein FlhF [Desulfuromonas versatilis]
MQVKTFEAEDMASALKMVKEALGPDALILSTRTVRKGGLGLLGKPVLEVTAAVEVPSAEPRPAPAAQPSAAAALARAMAQIPEPDPADSEEISYADIWRKRRVIDPIEEELEGLKGKLSTLNVDSLRSEINELKDLVRNVVQQPAQPPAAAPAPAAKRGSGIARMMDSLVTRGVEADSAEIIIRRALADYPPQNRSVTVEQFLSGIISQMLRVSGPITRPAKGPRKVALIGPTGVGKTTTAAKLAAQTLLADRSKRIAMVTIDIYRIAAAEQLKVYGEIMNVPVDVVLSPEELARAFARHQDKDLILVDTAGRSPKDDAAIAEMGRFLGPGSGVENHLVLSATTRETEMYGAVKRFSRLPVQSIIFTKVDECESLGQLLNLHLKTRYPLSYITNGQRVPEDLALAEPARLAGLIMAKL